MNRQEIMDLIHNEIDYNSKLAIEYLNKKDTSNANMRIYTNNRLIKLSREINKLIWK